MLQTTLSLIYIPLFETLYMVLASAALATLLGIPLGILLFSSKPHGILANRWRFALLNGFVNIVRSIPYVILMIALIPLTRLLVGTSIGTDAAIVSLTFAAIPFVGRVVENALDTVPSSLLETATAMGATPWQIILKFLLPESRSAIIQGITLTMINLVAYSAMAGAIGGGGLGDLAIRYGYQRLDIPVMCGTIVVLIALVQLIQSLGAKLSRQMG